MLESLRHASSLEAWEGGDKYGDAQEDQVRDGNFDINALAPRCDRNACPTITPCLQSVSTDAPSLALHLSPVHSDLT